MDNGIFLLVSFIFSVFLLISPISFIFLIFLLFIQSSLCFPGSRKCIPFPFSISFQSAHFLSLSPLYVYPRLNLSGLSLDDTSRQYVFLRVVDVGFKSLVLCRCLAFCFLRFRSLLLQSSGGDLISWFSMHGQAELVLLFGTCLITQWILRLLVCVCFERENTESTKKESK